MNLDLDFENMSEQDILESIRPEIMRYISPELYNRLEVIPSMGLSATLLDQLILNMLQGIQLEHSERLTVLISTIFTTLIDSENHFKSIRSKIWTMQRQSSEP